MRKARDRTACVHSSFRSGLHSSIRLNACVYGSGKRHEKQYQLSLPYPGFSHDPSHNLTDCVLSSPAKAYRLQGKAHQSSNRPEQVSHTQWLRHDLLRHCILLARRFHQSNKVWAPPTDALFELLYKSVDNDTFLRDRRANLFKRWEGRRLALRTLSATARSCWRS